MSLLISKYNTRRILIDIGGDGITDDRDGVGGSGGAADTGVKTPDNSAGATGFDSGNSNWWNNVVDGRTGTWVSDPVDTKNNVVHGFSIASSAIPGGTFANDYSMNFGGSTTAVGDYPSSAVRDNVYLHGTAGVVNLTIVVPNGKKMAIKFWGTRADGATRTSEFKLSTDGSYTQSYNASNNSTYATSANFSNLTGTVVINMRVAVGSTFGHISVMDITLTDNY
jgi:hypothetical protein